MYDQKFAVIARLDKSRNFEVCFGLIPRRYP